MKASNLRTCSVVSIITSTFALTVVSQALATDCHTPQPIGDGTHVGAFTPQAVQRSGVPRETWFEYTPSSAGELVVDSIGSDSAVWVEIWDGCPEGDGAELNRSFDGVQITPSVRAVIDPNRTYNIRVREMDPRGGSFMLTVGIQEFDLRQPPGADVVYSDITSTLRFGPVNGIHAYALSSNTCNVGTQNLLWTNNGTPGLAMNAYRLHNGRLVQIGMGWVKHACCAGAGSGCGMTCNGAGGSVLGAGCLDVYSASWNSSQARLGARSGINAFTGQFSPLNGTSGDAIFKRLQVAQADMSSVTYPGALYFVEGVYVGSDDATAKNGLNNASYRRVLVDASYNMTTTGTVNSRAPAIVAWRLNGGGAGILDPNVTDGLIDLPNEGRFHTAVKVTNLGGGMWRYDYAIYNLNSDISGGALRIPIPSNAVVANAGFNAPRYHSGEPYSNSPWTITVSQNEVVFASPETFAQNPNTNALRWGTMYNFWFDSNKPPTAGVATLGLFKPFTQPDVPFSATIPTNPAIAADFNADGCVDNADLGILLNGWNCSGGCMGDADGDGSTNETDLGLLLQAWNTGC
ncbi:MAG: hypothetical protein U1D55_08215 [Phycisphaerae bacterium]